MSRQEQLHKQSEQQHSPRYTTPFTPDAISLSPYPKASELELEPVLAPSVLAAVIKHTVFVKASSFVVQRSKEKPPLSSIAREEIDSTSRRKPHEDYNAQLQLESREDRVGSKRISPAAALHGVPPLESFEAVEHPSEPVDLDQPVRCPPPEPSIMQDGRLWKERIENLRRRNEMRSRESCEQFVRTGSTPGNRRNHSASFNNRSLLVAHSAPEHVVRRLLE